MEAEAEQFTTANVVKKAAAKGKGKISQSAGTTGSNSALWKAVSESQMISNADIKDRMPPESDFEPPPSESECTVKRRKVREKAAGERKLGGGAGTVAGSSSQATNTSSKGVEGGCMERRQQQEVT